MPFDFRGLTAGINEMPCVEATENHAIFRMGKKFLRLTYENDKFYIRVTNPDHRFHDLLKVTPDIHSALRFVGYAGEPK